MTAAHVSGPRDDDTAASVERAVELLKEALALLDSCDAPPEIGARLQEVISEAQELR